MTLQFNIVYTAGTAKFLSFFVWSLLKHSDCTFRLVSNGCLPIEQRFLQRLCHREPRLEYWAIPTRRTLPHGQALNYLQALNRSDYFCFIDSDIFATDDFICDLRPLLTAHTGVFSGTPIWVKSCEEVMPTAFRHLTGVFNRSDRGLCLGSTYVALYDNHVLTQLMQFAGIGFEEYRWSELSTTVRASLTSLGMEKESYDTGKVLNLLLLAQNATLTHVTSPALCHIGGTSFQVAYNNQRSTLKEQLINQLMRSPIGSPIKQFKQRRAMATYRRLYQTAPQAEFQFNATQRSQHRNPVRQYLLQLLNATFYNAPMPEPLMTGDAEIDDRLHNAKSLVLSLFEEYHDKLALND